VHFKCYDKINFTWLSIVNEIADQSSEFAIWYKASCDILLTWPKPRSIHSVLVTGKAVSLAYNLQLYLRSSILKTIIRIGQKLFENREL